MSQIPFTETSHPGPAPGGPRPPTAVRPTRGAASFNDHLERAGRPAEQAQVAAEMPKDESTSQRQGKVDEDRSTDRPIANDPQSDAGTAQDSTGDTGTVTETTTETTAEADADQTLAVEDEATLGGDVLQLSDDAEGLVVQNSTDDALPTGVAVAASGEIGAIDDARSVTAVARRLGRGAGDESSAASRVLEDAADGQADTPDERTSDGAGRRAPLAADRRRAAGSEVTANSDQIETEENENTQRITPSTTKDSPLGDVNTKDGPAVPKLPTEASTTSEAPGDLVENDKPADALASPQTGNRSSGLVDSDAQRSTRAQGAVATNKSDGAATDGGQPASREPSSPTQGTPLFAAVEAMPAQGAQRAVDTAAVDVESDRPGETTSAPTTLTLESDGEIDRMTPQRDTIRVGSRLATAKLGAGERGSVDRARFVGRVAGAFQAAGRDGGEVRLRLHPPELGVVRLEVKMDAGVLTARIETETSAARAVLLDNMAALRERLAEQGIKIEKFNVDLMDRRSEDAPYGPSGKNERENDPSSPDAESTPEPLDRQDGLAEESPSSIPAPAGNAGQLNVVI